jgi:hypothetical protein
LKVAGIIFDENGKDGIEEVKYLFGLNPPIATMSAIEVSCIMFCC